MEFTERNDFCDVCYTRQSRLGIRLPIIDDHGAFICRDCIEAMAEQLGILEEAREEILDAIR